MSHAVLGQIMLTRLRWVDQPETTQELKSFCSKCSEGNKNFMLCKDASLEDMVSGFWGKKLGTIASLNLSELKAYFIHKYTILR